MSTPQVSPSTGESLTRIECLRRRADYLKCYRQGRRRHGSWAILYFSPNHLDHPRIGITTSRKVGGAVMRHRLRRRSKEIFRRWPKRRGLPAVDFVIHFRPGTGKVAFGDLRRDLLNLLGSLSGQRQ